MRVRILTAMMFEHASHPAGSVLDLADDSAAVHLARGTAEPEGALAEREAVELKAKAIEARETVKRAEAAEEAAQRAAQKAADKLAAEKAAKAKEGTR